MHRIALVVLLFGLCPSLASEPCAEHGTSLRAGAAMVDITPEQFPVSMTGSFLDRQATATNPQDFESDTEVLLRDPSPPIGDK